MEPRERGSVSPKDPHGSSVHVQIVGLNADREKCRHGGEGEIFLLISPSIGRFYDGQPEAEAQLKKEAPIE